MQENMIQGTYNDGEVAGKLWEGKSKEIGYRQNTVLLQQPDLNIILYPNGTLRIKFKTGYGYNAVNSIAGKPVRSTY